MSRYYLHLLLALLLITINAQTVSNTYLDPIFVFSLSTIENSYAYLTVGGLKGGTKLFIDGFGFDYEPDNNLVYFGTMRCPVVQANFFRIACVTTAYATGDKLNLPLSIFVQDKEPFISTQFNFSFSQDNTPYLRVVSPRTSPYGSRVAFDGLHKIYNLGSQNYPSDIRGLYIGQNLCSRQNVYQPWAPSTYLDLLCDISDQNQEAGYYNITQWVVPGYAENSKDMMTGGVLHQGSYQFTLVPAVNQVSAHSGGSAGNRLTISGSGFSNNPENVTVMVAGLPCKIKSSSYKQIVCDVDIDFENNNYGKLSSNSTSQANGFISGSGWKKQVFYFSGYGPDRKVYWDLRKSPYFSTTSNNFESQPVLGQLETTNPYSATTPPSLFAAGYFVAPKTGTYTFRARAGSPFFVYKSSFKGSQEIDYSYPPFLVRESSAKPTMSSTSHFAVNDEKMTAAPIQMEKGDSFYMEVFAHYVDSREYFQVSVEISNDDPNYINLAYEVQLIELKYEEQPEILRFNHIGANTGSYNYLILIENQNAEVIYNYNQSVPFDSTAAQFSSMLKSFSNFYPYQFIVELEIYDSNDQLISITNQPPYRYQYTVVISSIRSQAHKSNVYDFTVSSQGTFNETDYTQGQATFQLIQEHSAPLGGYFTISFNNTYLSTYAINATTYSTEIPYNIDSTNFTNWMRRSFGSQIVVDKVQNRWSVSFIGLKGDLPTIVAYSDGLEGGASSPEIVVTTVREGSNNMYINPINSEFLRMSSPKPSVLVEVNGVLAQCRGDCSYEINNDNVPQITAVSLQEHYLLITLDADIAAPYQVTFAFQPCSYVEGNYLNYKCSLPCHSDGSPILEAGSYLPRVYLGSKGYANYHQDLQKIDIPLLISSLTPNQGFVDGGLEVVMTGKGFPLDSTRSFTLTQCNGKNVQIVSVTNNAIKFFSVPCSQGSSEVVFTFNSLTASATFTYTGSQTMKVTSIAPVSFSPVLKGFMNITGEEFGTDKSELTVWLTQNSENIYQLNVLDVNNTNIYVRIPGGESGEFRVTVNKKSSGYASIEPSDANKFVYGIFVTSFSPSTGSINGGTVLTIQGENFSADKRENQVYVGAAANWICKIISATPTEITCRTPPIHPSYLELEQDVVVVGRAMIESECKGNCKFTYENVTYPKLTSDPSIKQYVVGQQVVLEGESLGDSPAKVFVGDVEAGVTESNDTHVTFVYPELARGEYDINVYVEGVGYASPTLKSATKFDISTLSFDGSIMGTVFVVEGNGFLPLPNSKFKVQVEPRTCDYKILPGNTPTKMTVDVGDCSPILVKFNFTLDSISRIVEYHSNHDLTPFAFLISETTVQYATPISVRFNQAFDAADQLPTKIVAYPVDQANKKYSDDEYTLEITYNEETKFTAESSLLAAGKYAFKIFYENFGYAVISQLLQIQPAVAPSVGADLESGYKGGALIEVTGEGLSRFSRLYIDNHFEAQLDHSLSTTSTLTFRSPAYVSPLSNQVYNLAAETLLEGAPIASGPDADFVFDNMLSTGFIPSSGQWHIGLDLGEHRSAIVSKVAFYSQKGHSRNLNGATISGSNDRLDWTVLTTLSNQHDGWNTWKPDAPIDTGFRYIVLTNNDKNDACSLKELRVYGYISSTNNLQSLSENEFDLTFTDGYHSSQIGKITYKQSSTPVVSEITPRFGKPAGNYPIVIAGTGFGEDSSKVKVSIDSIQCSVIEVTDMLIRCTVGERPAMPDRNTFVVEVGGNSAVIESEPFVYGYRWSDDSTWGGDFPPAEGDTVYVPPGMVLIVDQSTSKLFMILVEGAVIFSDEVPIVVQAEYLLVINGRLQAGSVTKPYQSELTFILEGNYYTKQLPAFGNKVLGCHLCTLDLHGSNRDVVWTELESTVNAGDLTLTLTQEVDWVVGDSIVVASSSFSHQQSEERVIKSIDATKKTVTVNSPFVYEHRGESLTYGTETVQLRSEVGLLSRNIRFRGAEHSEFRNYGAHLMLHGEAEKGLNARISNVEFSQCGQQRTVRNCIHFKNNGDLSDSFVKSTSIHHSYSRAITVSSGSHLTIYNNLGYSVMGHSIFLQNGLEEHNRIENNLMVSTLATKLLYQSDIVPASYWISNPLNHLKGNRAAGSDGFGFYYHLQDDAVSGNCPSGLTLQQSSNNSAHSNSKSGLRISKLFSKPDACSNGVQDSTTDSSILNTFSNYKLWRNKQNGLHLQHGGNLLFSEFILIDHGRSGAEFEVTNYSAYTHPVVLRDSLIVGNANNQFSSYSGIITPRSDGSRYQNLRFYNFPSTSTVISVGSRNDAYSFSTAFGRAYSFKNTSITKNLGNYIYWIANQNNIIYDEDGSLSILFDGTTRTRSTIIPYYNHFSAQSNCFNATNATQWASSMLCNEQVFVNSISIIEAYIQYNYAFYFSRINSTGQNAGSSYVFPRLESQTGFVKVASTNAISGQTYLIERPSNYWNFAFDYDSLGFFLNFYMPESYNAFIVKVGYSEYYQKLTTIHRGYGGSIVNVQEEAVSELDKSTCKFGQFKNNKEKRQVEICFSSKGWAIGHYVTLKYYPCIVCPQPTPPDPEPNPNPNPEPNPNPIPNPPPVPEKPAINCQGPDTHLLWSDVTIWKDQIIPGVGSNIIIPRNCTIELDMDIIGLNSLTIDGKLIVKDENRLITSRFIWVKSGILQAGQPNTPFQSNLTIILLGTRTSLTFPINQIINWNKYMIVTGKLLLYGKIPTTIYTRLTSVALKGSQAIDVESTEGWEVGQTLGISPSFNRFYEYEKVVISSLTATSVSFDTPLKYTHYGNQSILENSYGTLDMRASVGVIDRNIKIRKEETDINWGSAVLVYGWNHEGTITSGSAVIQGVQFVNGGQGSTTKAALNVINTNIGSNQTNVRGNSFEDCEGYCLYLSNARNLKIQSNFIFGGQKYLVYAEKMFKYDFVDNVMIGARNRTTAPANFVDDIACYTQYTTLNFGSDSNNVQNNICQGSEGEGFILPFVPCSQWKENTGFINNVAGSSKIGFLFNSAVDVQANDCLQAGLLKAYNTKVGVTSNPKAKTLVWDRLMLSENERGIGLRFGGYNKNNNNSLFLKNSWISAISRPECGDCYGEEAKCSNSYAIRLLTVSEDTYKLPTVFGEDTEKLEKAELLDANAWIINTTFSNYKLDYATSSDAVDLSHLSSKCSNNTLFRLHPSVDSNVANHHLYNTTCANCQLESFGYYDEPLQANLGYEGGCGSMLCTGRINYLIYDHTGHLLGHTGMLTPNNSLFSNYQDCQRNQLINGYVCNTLNFGKLIYKNIAADAQKRVMWPVTLKNEVNPTDENQTEIVTVTNGWREWEWSGKEPKGRRLGQFVSLLQLNRTYNLSFESQPPSDMLLSFSSLVLAATPQSKSNWVCLKLYYPLPNAIVVAHANGSETKSILSTSSESVISYSSHCGAYKYLYKSSIVHFIVTSDPSCIVRVSLSSSVQVTARLNIEIDKFFQTNGEVKFLDLISAFLGITTNRLKIVGVYSGSTIINFNILPNLSSVDNSEQFSPNSLDIVNDLKELSSKLNQATGHDIDGLMGISTILSVMDESGNSGGVENVSENEFNKLMMIGIIVGIIVLAGVIVTIVLIVRSIRKRSQVGIIDQPTVVDLNAQNKEIEIQMPPLPLRIQNTNETQPNDIQHIDLNHNTKRPINIKDRKGWNYASYNKK